MKIKNGKNNLEAKITRSSGGGGCDGCDGCVDGDVDGDDDGCLG